MLHRFIRMKKIVGARQNIEFTIFPVKALVNESDFTTAYEVVIAETLTFMYGCNDADILSKKIFPKNKPNLKCVRHKLNNGYEPSSIWDGPRRI